MGNVVKGLCRTIDGNANKQDFPFLKTCVSPSEQPQPSVRASWQMSIDGRLRICGFIWKYDHSVLLKKERNRSCLLSESARAILREKENIREHAYVFD